MMNGHHGILAAGPVEGTCRMDSSGPMGLDAKYFVCAQNGSECAGVRGWRGRACRGVVGG